MADVLVKQFTYQTDSRSDSDRISRLYIKVFGDGTFIREVSEITETQSDAAALSRTKTSVEKYGITAVNGTRYILESAAPPTPPPTPTPSPPSTVTNTAILNDAEGTTLTGTSVPNPDTEWGDRTSSSRTAQVKASKNGRTYEEALYNFYSRDTEQNQKGIWERMYEDIASEIYNDDVDRDPTIEDKFPDGYTVKVTSFTYTTVPPDRPKPTPPPPVEAEKPYEPPTPVEGPKRYIPEGRYRKPASTSGGEFVELESGEPYKGFYIETYKGKFYAGKTPEENGPELVKEKKIADQIALLGIVGAIVPGLLAGFFKKKLTPFEKKKGVTKRNFIQDKDNNKIIETDPETFEQAKQVLVNNRFAQVDWITKGPAEDKMFGKYPFEGAASKNRKAILAAEKNMPGISLFVTNYSLYVEEPVSAVQNQLTSETEVERDPLVELDNSRKARFDTRK
jgi:hypothetical protein